MVGMMVALWVWVSCEMVGSDGIGREKSKSDDARKRGEASQKGGMRNES
jgi:hypothetical protein